MSEKDTDETPMPVEYGFAHAMVVFVAALVFPTSHPDYRVGAFTLAVLITMATMYPFKDTTRHKIVTTLEMTGGIALCLVVLFRLLLGL